VCNTLGLVTVNLLGSLELARVDLLGCKQRKLGISKMIVLEFGIG